MKVANNKIAKYKNMRFILNPTLKTLEERQALVDEIFERLPYDSFKNTELEAISNYLIQPTIKKGDRTISTDNRKVTIRKREISADNLIEGKLEGGEDTFHLFITNNTKNTILTPKIGITEKDIEEVPGLKEIREDIKKLEEEVERRSKNGEDVRYLKRDIIELRKKQYIVKNAYRQPIPHKTQNHSFGSYMNINLDFGDIKSVKKFLEFYPAIAKECNPASISTNIYNNYKTGAGSDIYALFMDFNDILNQSLKEKPMLAFITKGRLDGYSNKEIKEMLEKYCNISYSADYIATLFRTEIPKLITEKAKELGRC